MSRLNTIIIRELHVSKPSNLVWHDHDDYHFSLVASYATRVDVLYVRTYYLHVALLIPLFSVLDKPELPSSLPKAMLQLTTSTCVAYNLSI